MLTNYRIRDLLKAAEGERRIANALEDMPGLLELKNRKAHESPLLGARIATCLHISTATGVLITTLKALGAEISLSSCNPLSCQDDIAAALVTKGVRVFAFSEQTRDQAEECFQNVLDFNGEGPNLLLDDGAELIQRVLKDRRDLLPEIFGASEQTTSGVVVLRKIHQQSGIPFPVILVNESITKSKFDNLYGSRESFVDGFKRATGLMLAGKCACVIGFGQVGKGCAQALQMAGCRIIIVEIDPICALQAAMEGFAVLKIEDALTQASIFVTATGNQNVISGEHFKAMKTGSIVCNMGHDDVEFNYEWLLRQSGACRESINEYLEKFTFPNGPTIKILGRGRIVNCVCSSGHPDFVMSCSFSNQVLAMCELWQNFYPAGLHKMPRHLDEMVASIHLPSLRADLSELTPEQAAYLGVPVEGPFKDENYGY